jgi:hypothetical protein
VLSVRGVLIGAVTALGIVVGPTASAQTAQTAQTANVELSSFAVRSTALGVTVRETAIGAVPSGTDVIVASSSLAEAELTSTSSTALAALPYPTDQVLSLPGAVAGLGGVPAPPGYPLAARADHPFTPDASATPPGQPGATVTAHADADAASSRADGPAAADTTGIGPSLPTVPGVGAGGPAFTVGAVHNQADAERAIDGSMKLTATSSMSDVSLLGGAFHAAQVSSTSTVILRNGKAEPGPNDVQVGGATLAGAPVTVGPEGLVVGPQSVAVAPLVTPFTDALRTAGVGMTLTPATQQVDGPTSRLSSGSLRLNFGATVNGFPLTVQMDFGGTEVVTQAVIGDAPASDQSPADFVGAPQTTPPADPTPLQAAGGATDPSAAAGSTPSPASAGAVASAAPTAVARQRRASRPVTFASAATTRLDFRPVYVWLVLLGLVAVAARQLVRRAVPKSTQPGLSDLWRW